MAALRSLLFMVVFYSISTLYVIVALVAAVTSRRFMLAVIYAWVRFHRFCARWILGVRIRIEGAIPVGQYLYAAKHQAMFETIDLLNMLDSPAPVMKKELTRILGWGWIAGRYGVVAVDRKGGVRAMRDMLRRTRQLLATDRSVVIFPEGTRVLPGETPQLQAGFAGLYKMYGLPVVPIAIDSGSCWPRNSWIKRPGIVTFRFFEPIPPGLPRGEIEARVHALINDLERGGD